MYGITFGFAALLIASVGNAATPEAGPDIAKAEPRQHVAEPMKRHETHLEASVGTVAASVVPGIVGTELVFASFSEEDRSLLREFALSLKSVERAAAEPVVQKMCALPEDDIERVRLFEDAWRTQEEARARAAESLMGRLSPEGAHSLGTLVRQRMPSTTSRVNWEGLAKDSPEMVFSTIEGACRQYRIVLDDERANPRQAAPSPASFGSPGAPPAGVQ